MAESENDSDEIIIDERREAIQIEEGTPPRTPF